MLNLNKRVCTFAAAAVMVVAVSVAALTPSILSLGSPVADGVYAENDGLNSVLVPSSSPHGYVEFTVTRQNGAPSTLEGQTLAFTSGDDTVFSETASWNDTPGTVTSTMISNAGNDDFEDLTPNTAKFRLNLNGNLPTGGTLTIAVGGVSGSAITMAHP